MRPRRSGIGLFIMHLVETSFVELGFELVWPYVVTCLVLFTRPFSQMPLNVSPGN